jgi:hypothetical protein
MKYLALALLVATGLMTAVEGQGLSSNDAAESSGEPGFNSYSFPNPGFDSLEVFVKENYGESLDTATLSSAKLDDRAAVTFWTTSRVSRDFNILFAQSDATWVLMTTAALKFIRDTSLTANTAVAPDAKAVTGPKPESIAQLPLSSPCLTQTNACNCVYFAKCMAPWMNPQRLDLTSFANKKRLINSQIPVTGSVAVIQVLSGSYAFNGHLAIVLAVNRNAAGQITTIAIGEANWNPCSFDERVDTPANLHIVGYEIQ